MVVARRQPGDLGLDDDHGDFWSRCSLDLSNTRVLQEDTTDGHGTMWPVQFLAMVPVAVELPGRS